MNKGRTMWTAFVLVGLFVLIQLVQPSRSNPSVIASRTLESHVPVPARVQSILKRSCYNCHSSETVWPWYSRVAPVSWLIADDVKQARQHINFQDWEAQENPKEANEHLGLMCKQVREGTMPPLSYRIMHKESPLSADDMAAVCSWAQTFAAPGDSDEKGN
jgi:hypothetical protein